MIALRDFNNARCRIAQSISTSTFMYRALLAAVEEAPQGGPGGQRYLLLDDRLAP